MRYFRLRSGRVEELTREDFHDWLDDIARDNAYEELWKEGRLEEPDTDEIILRNCERVDERQESLKWNYLVQSAGGGFNSGTMTFYLRGDVLEEWN